MTDPVKSIILFAYSKYKSWLYKSYQKYLGSLNGNDLQKIEKSLENKQLNIWGMSKKIVSSNFGGNSKLPPLNT